MKGKELANINVSFNASKEVNLFNFFKSRAMLDIIPTFNECLSYKHRTSDIEGLIDVNGVSQQEYDNAKQRRNRLLADKKIYKYVFGNDGERYISLNMANSISRLSRGWKVIRKDDRNLLHTDILFHKSFIETFINLVNNNLLHSCHDGDAFFRYAYKFLRNGNLIEDDKSIDADTAVAEHLGQDLLKQFLMLARLGVAIDKEGKASLIMEMEGFREAEQRISILTLALSPKTLYHHDVIHYENDINSNVKLHYIMQNIKQTLAEKVDDNFTMALQIRYWQEARRLDYLFLDINKALRAAEQRITREILTLLEGSASSFLLELSELSPDFFMDSSIYGRGGELLLRKELYKLIGRLDMLQAKLNSVWPFIGDKEEVVRRFNEANVENKKVELKVSEIVLQVNDALASKEKRDIDFDRVALYREYELIVNKDINKLKEKVKRYKRKQRSLLETEKLYYEYYYLLTAFSSLCLYRGWRGGEKCYTALSYLLNSNKIFYSLHKIILSPVALVVCSRLFQSRLIGSKEGDILPFKNCSILHFTRGVYFILASNVLNCLCKNFSEKTIGNIFYNFTPYAIGQKLVEKADKRAWNIERIFFILAGASVSTYLANLIMLKSNPVINIFSPSQLPFILSNSVLFLADRKGREAKNAFPSMLAATTSSSLLYSIVDSRFAASGPTARSLVSKLICLSLVEAYSGAIAQSIKNTCISKSGAQIRLNWSY